MSGARGGGAENTLRVVFVQFILIPANLYIIVGHMTKETVRSSKLRNFEIRIQNLRKKLVIKKS